MSIGLYSCYKGVFANITVSVELLTKPHAILLDYVVSVRFVLDVLAVLPLELLSIIWISSSQEWKYIPIFRLNRLLKFWKVHLHQFFSILCVSVYGAYCR